VLPDGCPEHHAKTEDGGKMSNEQHKLDHFGLSSPNVGGIRGPFMI